MNVSTVSEMRSMDRTAIDEFGIPETLLMENAGLAAFEVLRRNIGIGGKKIVVFCGIGNNGGDGFVVARKIFSNGGTVKIIILGDPAKYKGAAKANLDIAKRLSLDIERYDTTLHLRSEVRHSHGIVDAIFGTGLARDIEGTYRETIELINESRKPVLSLDIPSGVHGDTGQIMGIAVRADFTVTFGLPKIGNMLFPGYDLCGRLFVTHISFPPALYDNATLKIAINSSPDLPPRKRDGHKGEFGDILFIAGAAGYFGAPYLAALSFLKAGGGYSRLASPHSIIPALAARGSEIVFVPQNETATGSIALENKDALLYLSEKSNMVVIGPGLSLHPETLQLVRDLVREINRPILIDGDGISALADDPDFIAARPAETILTPHLGEMSRITQKTTSEIKKNRIDILQNTSHRLNAMIVLKGAHSLIGFPEGNVFINMSGNSGMATAGSGDVLAGTIAAMFGLGLSVTDAVRKGVFMHGLSGDLAAQNKGTDGITAHDIMDTLPSALQLDRKGLEKAFRDRYRGAQII